MRSILGKELKEINLFKCLRETNIYTINAYIYERTHTNIEKNRDIYTLYIYIHKCIEYIHTNIHICT